MVMHLAWWARKGCHLVLAVVVSALFLKADQTHRVWPLVVLGSLGAVLIMIDQLRPWLRHRFWCELFASERHHRIGCLTYGVLGGVVTWLISGPAFAALAMLLMGAVDATAALVGRYFGRVALPYQPAKTWEGSLGGLAAGLVVLACWPIWQPAGVFILLTISLVESVSDGMVDNFASPVGAATVMMILRQLRLV